MAVQLTATNGELQLFDITNTDSKIKIKTIYESIVLSNTMYQKITLPINLEDGKVWEVTNQFYQKLLDHYYTLNGYRKETLERFWTLPTITFASDHSGVITANQFCISKVEQKQEYLLELVPGALTMDKQIILDLANGKYKIFQKEWIDWIEGLRECAIDIEDTLPKTLIKQIEALVQW